MRRIILALLALLPLLTIAPACDFCELEIVQVSPYLGKVRVHNTCAAPVSAEKQLCVGQGGAYEACKQLGEGTIEAGGCVDVDVDVASMLAPKSAAALAVFGAGVDTTTIPQDMVAWGIASIYKGADGLKSAPAAKSLSMTSSLTRGQEGWYGVGSGPVMTSCGTWEHRVHVPTRVCLPTLVEVHPGPGSFLKVAMPPGCPERDMSEFHLSWGTDGLKVALPMPAATMSGGECITIGGPESMPDNGLLQFAWEQVFPHDLNAEHFLETGSTGLTVMAAVLWGGEAQNGVRWGGTKDWPNLVPADVGAVPAGRSLRWDGEAWTVAPTSGNQCPKWDIDNPEKK